MRSNDEVSGEAAGEPNPAHEAIAVDEAMGDAMKRRHSRRAKLRSNAGFSLIEVVISMAILTVGLVSLLGVFGLAMASTQTSQQDMIAKQLANESYESIITARNTSQINWDQINNVGSTICPVSGGSSCGIFLTGSQAIYGAGNDGIYGTSDDAAAGEQYLQDPGPDGIYGNTDDVRIYLTNFQRSVTISPLYDTNGNLVTTLRSITVTVTYKTPQQTNTKSYTLNSYISQFQ